MASDRVSTGDPVAELPELSGALRPPAPAAIPQTLSGELVPVADSIRELYADFGVHRHRVFLVHAAWTGGRIGVGEMQITSRRELLPPPRVRDMSSIRRNLRPEGLTEEGDIMIDRISAKYAEDDLLGRTPDVKDAVLPRTSRSDVSFWIEVQEARAVGTPTVIRRFSPPAAAPQLSGNGLSWQITVTKQGEDRGRTGGLDDF